jgi:heat shock protein HslJ
MRAVPVALAMVAALAGSTAAQSPAVSGTATADGLDGTNWSLASLTVGGTAMPLVPGAGATLAFVGGAAGGSTGCNRFSAPYTADAATLTLGTIMATRTACDDTSMAFEAAYLTALSTVASYTSVGSTLTLMDGTGATVLAFGAAPMPTVEGSWIVTGFSDGSATITPSTGSGLTVTFTSDGRTEGHGGCNGFGGPYGLSEDQISIGPLMSTMKSCGETLDNQEQDYLGALQQAITWAVTSGTLELRDSTGALLVSAGRAGG